MTKIIFDKATCLQIVHQYVNDKFSLADLSRKYQVHLRVIRRTLLDNGITLRNSSEYNRVYSHNEHVFDNIDTPEKAYWLGFLVGDGNVSGTTIQVALSSKDKEHLEKFKKFLGSTHPIYERERECKWTNKITGSPYVSHIQYVYLGFSSPLITQALGKNFIVAHKTDRTKLPPIDSRLYNSFILGVFDADGSWIIDHARNHRFMSFQIAGHRGLLLEMQNILIKNCDLSVNKLIDDQYSIASKLRYGGNQQTRRISKYLYDDNNIFLERKFNIVNNFFNKDKTII